ncbi:MAG: DUF4372 domain-containing protein [Bacteroidales bacterium]|jgi:hypothetical protein|nr:DUF4372 domain-containing protein [Bacteroidales bacterium]
MGKDSIKNLVGQPIFKQIIKIIPKDKFDELVIVHQSDRYYKSCLCVKISKLEKMLLSQ